jgi:hypothetical protein
LFCLFSAFVLVVVGAIVKCLYEGDVPFLLLLLLLVSCCCLAVVDEALVGYLPLCMQWLPLEFIFLGGWPLIC